MGLTRSAAANYTFVIAVPLMFVACIYDLLRNFQYLSAGDLQVLAIGFRCILYRCLYFGIMVPEIFAEFQADQLCCLQNTVGRCNLLVFLTCKHCYKISACESIDKTGFILYNNKRILCWHSSIGRAADL